MITEQEIATIVEDNEIHDLVSDIKASFLGDEAPLYEMSNHDFFSLILMTPHVGVALSNGSVSLFEELSLNKKARRFSRGGAFLRKDPVVHAMNWLINGYDRWEERFLEVLKKIMYLTFDKDHLVIDDNIDEKDPELFHRVVLKTPYIFVKYLKAFFLTEDDAITLDRKISAIEFEKILFLGKKLELDKYKIFKMFCETFEVK